MKSVETSEEEEEDEEGTQWGYEEADVDVDESSTMIWF